MREDFSDLVAEHGDMVRGGRRRGRGGGDSCCVQVYMGSIMLNLCIRQTANADIGFCRARQSSDLFCHCGHRDGQLMCGWIGWTTPKLNASFLVRWEPHYCMGYFADGEEAETQDAARER